MALIHGLPRSFPESGWHSRLEQVEIASYLLSGFLWSHRGTELALEEGPGGVYVVESIRPTEDGSNLTDKKCPGNPTKSYCSRQPLRVRGEIMSWQWHSPEELNALKDSLERLQRQGVEPIDD